MARIKSILAKEEIESGLLPLVVELRIGELDVSERVMSKRRVVSENTAVNAVILSEQEAYRRSEEFKETIKVKALNALQNATGLPEDSLMHKRFKACFDAEFIEDNPGWDRRGVRRI